MKTFIYLDEAGQEMEEGLRAQDIFFFPRCLTNENIHYDVDENLWPSPQDRVDKNIKSSEEHSS